MPRKKVEHKYHFIYKTTNLKNGKFYVGMHSTSDLNDGYLGSGDRLRRAIRKHGKENFKLEILEFFENREQLANKEKELVNEDLLKDPMCMNLQPGGGGGCTESVQLLWSSAGGQALSNRLKYDSEFRVRHREWTSLNAKKLHLLGLFAYCDWTGKKHSEETKAKIGLGNSIKQKGELNSQYGTIWITNGVENKKIRRGDPIEKDWKLGRIFKNKIKLPAGSTSA